MLLGNPHFPWSGPNRFYEMHLTIPGQMDVMGVGIGTYPMVSIGFNKDVAWSHTVSTGKRFTLYELQLAEGDPTTYLVDGKPFGNSVHLGVDLASTAHAPIEAAANGIIVFAGALGIYGNAVIIDHGLGLFSLYGHLSAIETTVGKSVKKEEKIGVSGLSGLAGGDHLHFSILVGGEFVNPQEWWDPHWIEDNVMKKMTL